MGSKMTSKMGNALKLLRIQNNMSQIELARACGWPPNSGRISQYETGRRHPTAEDVKTMAKALGVSASRLQFPEEDPMYRPAEPRKMVPRDRHRVVEVDASSVRRRMLDASRLVQTRAAQLRVRDQDRLDAATVLYAEYDDMRMQSLEWLLAGVEDPLPTPSPDIEVVDWALKSANDNQISALRDRMMS